ncbi:hypothetical protein N7495_002423 [Penicillium taxi]|uniref:uncharacterized protein n=1 Tax=Penicillium taxi TaxID=168475 RepID=UPI002545365A|nr:uncharacterized protein N7495_002423 [Penicillium taxi]KAJ5901895.1 hypothetical protein N7495_002423 [Penicillium taxi]
MASAALTELYTLLSLGVAIIATRIIARLVMVGIKGLKLDDYVMCLACITFGVEVHLGTKVGEYQGLSNAGMTDEYRAALSPDSIEYSNRVNGSKLQLSGWACYMLTLWILKICMAVFYSRMTEGIKVLEIRVKIAYAMLAITFFAGFCTLYLSCRPFYQFWQINPNPGSQCLPAVSPVAVIANGVFNIVTDVYLLTIPIPSTGTGATIGGMWSIRESFVAIAVDNFPLIYPLVRRISHRLGFVSTHSGTKSHTEYTMSSKANTNLPRRKFGAKKEDWNNVSDENAILAGPHDPTSYTVDADADWDAGSTTSHTDHGIKVIQETIVERSNASK